MIIVINVIIFYCVYPPSDTVMHMPLVTHGLQTSITLHNRPALRATIQALSFWSRQDNNITFLIRYYRIRKPNHIVRASLPILFYLLFLFSFFIFSIIFQATALIIKLLSDIAPEVIIIVVYRYMVAGYN